MFGPCEAELCETSAHHGPQSGHEASSRQQDSAVLVSLMTAAVADNDQDSCESLCRCPLVRREPEEIFFVCACVCCCSCGTVPVSRMALASSRLGFLHLEMPPNKQLQQTTWSCQDIPNPKQHFQGLNTTKDAISQAQCLMVWPVIPRKSNFPVHRRLRHLGRSLKSELQKEPRQSSHLNMAAPFE